MNDIAFVICGGNSLPNLFPATVRWENYLHAAVTVGPNVKKAGLKRLLYHNPGGHYYFGWTPNPANPHDPVMVQQAKAAGVDTREMWIQQWLLAESAGLRFADRKALKLGHQVLEYFGIEEVIYYLGCPDAIKSQTVEDCYECIEMFLDCGKSASIAFDALSWFSGTAWTPGNYIDKLITRIKKEGHKVYTEPRFSQHQIDEGYAAKVDGTIAVRDYDILHNIDYTKQVNEVIIDPLIPAFVPGTFQRPINTTVCWRGPANMNWGLAP